MKGLVIAAALASLVLGSSTSPAGAEANVELENGSYEVTARVQGCDEYINFSGTIRFVYTRVLSAADRGFGNDHLNAANVVGVGETTGTTYRMVYVLGERGEGGADGAVGGSYELTVKIGGGGQIFGQKWVGRWTRTPNGDITVSFEEVIKEWACSA